VKYRNLLLAPVALLVGVLPLSSGEISYAGIVATVDETSDGVSFRLADDDVSAELPAGTRLKILQEGIFAHSDETGLQNLFSIFGTEDPDWYNVKYHIEMMRTEPPSAAQTGDTDEGVPRVHDLAFRAGLDANPRTALRKLEELGVRFASALDPDWEFDPESAADRARVVKGLDLLSSGMNAGPLRVAGSAGALYFGFPRAADPQTASVLWPLRKDAPLRLSPEESRQAYAAYKIGDRVLTGRPAWFAPDGRLGDHELVGCLPFGGCGYLDGDAVMPVLPIWIAFDRTTRTPLEVIVE
jgi:hypothetical protein